MTDHQKAGQFISEIRDSLAANIFTKLSLGNYRGNEADLKNITLKRILLKQEEQLSFNYRYKTRDITKNHPLPEALTQLEKLIGTDFHTATLQTTSFDLQFEIQKSGKTVLRKANANREAASLRHDKQKYRSISATNKTYLHALGVTDHAGNVLQSAQDKYRQINHYIELISSPIRELTGDQPLTIVDMGSGKGYLTFALYDYLVNVLHRKAEVTGVEFRDDLVKLCNGIAAEADFRGLHFEEGTIAAFERDKTDILIALHACDTATDDAIWKGIQSGASLIVVAPCCHKQIRREIEKTKPDNDVQFLTRYGIFLERQAEMVTDGIRALVLEYFGYKTKVLEFISDTHTPKNVMIVGERIGKGAPDKTRILQKISEAKAYFGIGYHHLERIAGIEV